MDVRWEAKLSVQEMVDEGVRRAYTDKDNPLRASMLADPAGTRKNTRDNTPAVVHMEIVPGDKVEVRLAAKGGGSENKARFAVLNPSDSVVDWILEQVPTMGGDWCPPGMLGIGIGGTAEKAMMLAKESLMEPARHARVESARAEDAHRGAADRDLRQGQCARHRRPGPRRTDHRARHQGARLPDPRHLAAGGRDTQLRRDPSRRISPGRQRARAHRYRLASSTGQSYQSISPVVRSGSIWRR